jgi:biotin-dependent carboxylase-like uncharacterized protein
MSTVQDKGRPGFGHLGVPPSGAIDTDLAAIMNRILGNPSDAAVFETAGGLVIEANSALLVASSDTGALQSLVPGQRYELRRSGERNFEYLAIRGGIQAPRVLGSVSHDTLSSLGPGPVEENGLWQIGPEPGTPILVDQVALSEPPSLAQIWPGPHLDHFTPDTLNVLLNSVWGTSHEFNRVGVRLKGPQLRLHTNVGIPSEPLLTGAIQVPPDGRPILMLRDHPTTGGYPVVAIVDPDDVATLAQTPPGRNFRLTLGSQEQTPSFSADTVRSRRR